MYKGFKIRIYPTKEQEQLFWRNIGACRYIWNYMLELQQKRYDAGEKYLSRFSMTNLITSLKRDGEHEWLCEIPRHSLDIVCQDLDEAYCHMFEKIAGRPKFKSRKRSKPTYPVRPNRFYFKDKARVVIEKVGKVKFKSDFDFPISRNCKFYNVRVSFDNNKWFVSFGMECETQTPVLTDKLMGIDLGIKELAVVAVDSEQFVFHNINKSQKVRNLEKK